MDVYISIDKEIIRRWLLQMKQSNEKNSYHFQVQLKSSLEYFPIFIRIDDHLRRAADKFIPQHSLYIRAPT